MKNTNRIAAALALALSLAAAQAAAAQATEVPIISFEYGYQAGYSLAASDIGSAMNFALGIGLSDKLLAQVSFVQGDAVFDSYRLLGLSYAISPKIGAVIMAGRNTAVAAVNFTGIGLYAVILSRSVAGSLLTDLKLKLNYLAPLTNYANGVLGFGLSAGIGM